MERCTSWLFRRYVKHKYETACIRTRVWIDKYVCVRGGFCSYRNMALYQQYEETTSMPRDLVLKVLKVWYIRQPIHLPNRLKTFHKVHMVVHEEKPMFRKSHLNLNIIVRTKTHWHTRLGVKAYQKHSLSFHQVLAVQKCYAHQVGCKSYFIIMSWDIFTDIQISHHNMLAGKLFTWLKKRR